MGYGILLGILYKILTWGTDLDILIMGTPWDVTMTYTNETKMETERFGKIC